MVYLSEAEKTAYINASNIFLALTNLTERMIKPLVTSKDARDLEGMLPSELKEGVRSIVGRIANYNRARRDVHQILKKQKATLDELSRRLPYASEVYANQVRLNLPLNLLFDSISVEPKFIEPSGSNALSDAESLRTDDLTFVAYFPFNGTKGQAIKGFGTKGTYLVKFEKVEDTLRFADRIDAVVKAYKS